MVLTIHQGKNDKTSRFYTCDVCGFRGRWSDTWAWYGSILDMEKYGLNRVALTCSDECRAKAQPEDLVKQKAGKRS